MLALAVAACGSDDESSGGGSLDLVIGDLVPFTGTLSAFGPPGEKAATLAVAQVQEAIEAAGGDQTVEIVHEDTESDPQASVQAARKAVGSSGASCIVGPWSSSNSLAVIESVTLAEGNVQISPGSTSDEITGLDDRGLMNRVVPPDSFQGPAIADAIEKTLGDVAGKTVNIGARNDAYGTGLVDTFTEAWEAKGGAIGASVIYDPEQPSYNSEARKITAGDPDAFVIIDFPETFAKVGPALVRTGQWSPAETFVSDGLSTSTLPEDVGTEITEGLRGTVPGVPDDGAAAQAFDTLYTSAPGPERNAFDAQNFDSVMLCYLAAAAAGSSDGPAMAEHLRAVSGPPGTEYTFEQLPEAIEALANGEDINYEGASGPIDLDEAGDPTSGTYDLFEFTGTEQRIFDEVEFGGAQ